MSYISASESSSNEESPEQKVSICIQMLCVWNSPEMWKNRIEGFLHLDRELDLKGELEGRDLVDSYPIQFMEISAVAKFIDLVRILIRRQIIDEHLAISLFGSDFEEWVKKFTQVKSSISPYRHDAWQTIATRWNNEVALGWRKTSTDPITAEWEKVKAVD